MHGCFMHGSVLSLPVLTAAAVLLVGGPGCGRQHWRQRADKDVAGVISQKNIFPEWRVLNWYVYPDPRARFADPTRPDRPPYPPDDYAARLLSPNPQRPSKKSGVGRIDGDAYIALLQQWDAENRAEDQPPAARGAGPFGSTFPFNPSDVKVNRLALDRGSPASPRPGAARVGPPSGKAAPDWNSVAPAIPVPTPIKPPPLVRSSPPPG